MGEPIEAETITVDISDHDSVTAMLYLAPKKGREGITLLLGHGAGANQTSPFMKLFASGLAARGMDAMTFNFLYMEQGRGAPDPNPKLEYCYRAVINAASRQKKLKGNRIVVGGKSMGGRIASQVAAKANDAALPGSSALSPISGLVLLGYPLHPPGKPEQLRDQHLKDISAPMLIVQGSRDAFGTGDEIRAVVKRLKLPATLHMVEGGDHSFKVPKSLGVPQLEVYENVMDEIARWLRTIPN